MSRKFSRHLQQDRLPRPPDDAETAWERLRIESMKLRALGHLIESERDQGVVPLDQDEIREGLGIIITESAGRIRRIAVQLEENELPRIRRKRGGG